MNAALLKPARLYEVRELTPFDAEELREIRLESLRHYGAIFDNFHKKESEKPLSYWIEQSTQTPDHCFFGLFDEDELIGVMAARKWEERPDDRIAFWWGNYTKPAYRGIGAARSLYQLRAAWTARQGFKTAVFYILDGAARPTEIMLKHGAVKTHSEPMRFFDGPEALWNWYEITQRKL